MFFSFFHRAPPQIRNILSQSLEVSLKTQTSSPPSSSSATVGGGAGAANMSSSSSTSSRLRATVSEEPHLGMRIIQLILRRQLERMVSLSLAMLSTVANVAITDDVARTSRKRTMLARPLALTVPSALSLPTWTLPVPTKLPTCSRSVFPRLRFAFSLYLSFDRPIYLPPPVPFL